MKNSSLLARFFYGQKLRIRCKFGKLADKSASNTPKFTRLILFNFYPKIWNITHLFLPLFYSCNVIFVPLPNWLSIWMSILSKVIISFTIESPKP